jgi:hypothetical protein
MSAIHDGGLNMGLGLIEQVNRNSVHKFEATSREQFEDIMKALKTMQEDVLKENKLKEKLRNLKGPKKNLSWKKE